MVAPGISDSFGFLLCLEPIPYHSFERILVHIFQTFKLDTITCHARLTQFLSKCFCEVSLILDTKDVYRDPSGICTDTNLKILLRSTICIFHEMRSKSNSRVCDSFVLTVLSIEEPQLRCGRHLKCESLQLTHVIAFSFGLTVDILFDL